MLARGNVFFFTRATMHRGLSRSGVRLMVVRMRGSDPVTSTISEVILVRPGDLLTPVAIGGNSFKKGWGDVTSISPLT